MKRILKNFLKSFFIMVFLFVGFLGFYFYNNHLFLWEARILWGQSPFEAENFENGSAKEKSKMVVDLIERQSFVGLKASSVPEILGHGTGDYYYSDENTTYRLTENGYADWILTFSADDQGRIKKVFIRKSCCSISKKIANFFILKVGGFILSIRPEGKDIKLSSAI